MGKTFAILGLVAILAAPVSALANTVEASLVPDGTYTVKVEKADPQHITVRMDNGLETTLTPKGALDFGKIKANDTVTLSVVQGKVPVYKIK